MYPTTYNGGVVVVNLKIIGLGPGSNPTIVSYNHCVAKMYNSITNSIAKF
jgi:hypothetical protein